MVFIGYEGNQLQLFDIQIEKGDTATPYEPYYIKSTTPVTQTTNHTLTAIWEKND